MSDITAVFIDDGGVMNDNILRAPEWQRLVGEYFAPRLGGDNMTWIEANRLVFAGLESVLHTGPGEQDYITWFEAYQLRWLREMSTFVGVTVPTDDAQCLKMVWQASDYITHRVRTAYPGVADAIRSLYKKGFSLFTASGQHSRELEGYLKGMGIRECFNTLYGSDLINQGKYSVEFYSCIFKHSGVDPDHALVVDDTLHNLVWAASLGVKTCLISDNPNKDIEVNLIIPVLKDLPAALEKLIS